MTKRRKERTSWKIGLRKCLHTINDFQLLLFLPVATRCKPHLIFIDVLKYCVIESILISVIIENHSKLSRCSDYAPAEELDRYDPTVLADDDDPELFESYEKRMRDRMAAEEELDALDIKRRERDMQSEYQLERVNRFEQQELDGFDDEEEEEEAVDGPARHLNLEAFDCPLREWIAEDRTREEIQRRFRKFLSSYYPNVDEITRWIKEHENVKPMPPLPSHLRISPAIYPRKIRYYCSL